MREFERLMLALEETFALGHANIPDGLKSLPGTSPGCRLRGHVNVDLRLPGRFFVPNRRELPNQLRFKGWIAEEHGVINYRAY